MTAMLAQWKLINPPLGVTSADPGAVFVVKSLLNPVIVVLTLIVCLLYWREPIGGPYVLVGVLAFIGAADFLEIARVRVRNSRLSVLILLMDIALRWALIIGFIWTLIRLSGLSQLLSGSVMSAWAVGTPVTLWAGQIAVQPLLLMIGLRRVPLRRAVVIGVTTVGCRLDDKLRDDPLLHTQVLGFFEQRDPSRLPPERLDRILGSLADLPGFVLRERINTVYITLPMNQSRRVLDLLDALRDSTVSIYFVPDLEVFNLIQARLDHLDGIPLVAVRESPFYGVRGFAKRLCDMLISAGVIMVCGPLLLLLAIAVRVSSPGPVIFKQKRYGLDGEEIVVYKFRTMTVTEDGERNYTQVIPNDSRVTSVGKLLRRTSLDELPQVFNVLEGSMSIVGPRPHAVFVNEQYRRLIPSYMVRHKVKPGITGWAQVNGYRGGDDLESMTRRINFDLEYLRHWSLGLDLMIIIKTATLIWNDKKAY
jgi:putative colanic acid biosynthesis UDP-glucose lipid carrier transferase